MMSKLMELTELVRADSYTHGKTGKQPLRMIETMCKLQKISEALEWRDVKKSLPEPNQVILCCYDFADNHPFVCIYDCERFMDYNLFVDEIELKPTHWKPLPDPKRKKEDPNETDWNPNQKGAENG